MSLSLQKGERVELSKGYKTYVVGLGWDINRKDGDAYDLDASAFLLNASGKVRSDGDFVFYGNQTHESKSVYSLGDDRTGGSSDDGDDEQIVVCLDKVPEDIKTISFVVTIYNAKKRHQNFGQVDNAYVRLVGIPDGVDPIEEIDKGEEVLRFNLTEDNCTNTAMQACTIYRQSNVWKFKADGDGFNNGLFGFCKLYGIDAEEEQ